MKRTLYALVLTKIEPAEKAPEANRVVLDGAEQPDRTVRLIDDRNSHDIEVDISGFAEEEAVHA
jgi:hypothetical protein